MPLSVNLRHLEAHDLELKGELPVAELGLDVHDDLIRAEQPLRYDFNVQKLDNSLLLNGTLKLTLKCQCARCLKSFERELALDNWTLHLPLEGEERAAVVNDLVDLTPFLREDILLEFPQHPLCEADCRGLLKSAIGEAKASNSGQPAPETSAWAELDKLKF